MASAMALAAIIILLKNPLQAWQAGFLLSFGAILGVCFVYPILQSVLEPQKKIYQTFLFSISLSLITAPLTIHFFYEYPLYSIFLNFIVLPCMPVVMGFGAAGTLAGCLTAPVGRMLGLPAHLVLSFYEFLGELIVEWPWAVLRPGREEGWQLVVYYILLIAALLLLWYGRRRIYFALLPAAFVILLLRFHSPLEFTMLDVGQGDGMLLRFPSGTTCLIDGGSTSVDKVGEYRLLPYLKYEGVSSLDYVILTHLDEDHINGVRELLEMSEGYDGVEIDCILFPDIANPDESYQNLWALAEQCGVKAGKIGAGDMLKEENLTMECLYPIKNSYSDDKNANSTVLLLTFDKFKLLLTGDLGFAGEEELLRRGVLEDVDVWKVSHHGSKYSGREEFLEVIRPNVSLISVGKNFYGHPSEEILQRLEKIGSHVENTLESGALRIESDGEVYFLKE